MKQVLKKFFKKLTTFCLSKSNLSHFNFDTSCLSDSPSKQPGHDFSVVSAELMLSRPVSLSAYTRSTLFKDESSLSDGFCTGRGFKSGLETGDAGALFLLLFERDLPV